MIETELSQKIESALVTGDLQRLTPDEKAEYYKSVCESVGLNPLTQPFAYILLNGKLQLYAKKDATDQLRKIHDVSVDELKHDFKDQLNLYIVTAIGHGRGGRRDASTGAVNTKGLAGDAMANAIMKAETKAKRRLTLSICGLGVLDETELDTAAGASVVLAPAPQAPVVPEVNHAPAVATDAPRPNERVVPGSLSKIDPQLTKTLVDVLAQPAIQEKLAEQGLEVNKPLVEQMRQNAALEDTPAKAIKGRKKAEKPETTVEVGGNPPAEGFKATDDDLPAEMFDQGGPPNIPGKSPENGQVAPQTTQPTGAEIAAKVRGYYSLVGRGDLQAYILKKTGKATSSEISPEQWGDVFAALDAQAGDKQAFQKFVKDGAF